jgi:membrane protein YdbS with pleckstrin-like domain
MTVPQSQILVEQAKQAKSRNDSVRARSLLSQVIKADPRNEEAWLLFADVAEKKEHAIYSLEQALKIDPVNMEALDRLNALKAPSSAPATSSPTLPALTPVTPSPATLDRIAVAPPKASGRETVILEERMHSAVFLSPLLIAVVGIAAGILIGSLRGLGMTSIGLLTGLFFILLAILELLRVSIRFATSHLTLTSKRIIIKRGFLSRNTFEVLLTKVEGIGVKQPPIGRMFGFGTIIVTGTGGAHQVFRGLRDPQKLRYCRENSLDCAQRFVNHDVVSNF